VNVALRPPPGRAGRLWLLHRIDSGHRGGEVLDQKRQALLREEARLRGEVERAEAEWRERAAEASACDGGRVAPSDRGDQAIRPGPRSENCLQIANVGEVA
jgi:hypothetical protein